MYGSYFKGTLTSKYYRKYYLTIAYLPSLNQVSCLIKDGEQSIDDSIASVNKCIEACLRLHSVMKDCLVTSTIDRANEDENST